MEFASIKVTEKGATLVALEDSDRATQKRDIVGKETPSPAFVDAYQGLLAHLPKLFARSPKHEKAWALILDEESEVKVTGLSITTIPRTESRAFTISAKLKVPCSNSPLNLTTPLILELEEDDRSDGDVFEAIESVIAHAREYASLVTDAQQDLFDGTPQRRPAGDVAQPTGDDALAAIERDRVLAEALASILPGRPKTKVNDVHLHDHLVAAFDNIGEDYQGAKYTGLFRHDEQWGFARVSRQAKLTFYFPVAAPDEFVEAVTIPSLVDAQIVQLARRAYWGDEEFTQNGKATKPVQELAPV